MLKAQNISYTAGHQRIIDNITSVFEAGKCNLILGPNGSGKSTLLKILSGDIRSFSGTVCYDEKNIHTYKPIELAAIRAVMSQHTELSFPIPVNEVVMMGRYPHFTFKPGKRDVEVCDTVISITQLNKLKARNYLTLSGGEKQRVQFARMLAQIWDIPADTHRYIFMDEPLNNLDIKYQQEFLQTVRSVISVNTTVIAVMHDINLATEYGDKLFFLKNGRIVKDGIPSTIISVELVKEIFDIHCSVLTNPVSGNPIIIPQNNSSIN